MAFLTIQFISLLQVANCTIRDREKGVHGRLDTGVGIMRESALTILYYYGTHRDSSRFPSCFGCLGEATITNRAKWKPSRFKV